MEVPDISDSAESEARTRTRMSSRLHKRVQAPQGVLSPGPAPFHDFLGAMERKRRERPQGRSLSYVHDLKFPVSRSGLDSQPGLKYGSSRRAALTVETETLSVPGEILGPGGGSNMEERETCQGEGVYTGQVKPVLSSPKEADYEFYHPRTVPSHQRTGIRLHLLREAGPALV